ncbi:phage major capsid protein [Alphaproteobacteria bacterium endosymbiont of Tiliacea citrago]|uniref:phage major capsid protein n=1 Tax=Alphaproteobacteria bacterium endosymbiont of Tiliacea citrago TaxID=3077944 RepID=UPI00313CE616
MQNIANNEVVSKGYVQATGFEGDSDVFGSFLTKCSESQFNGAISFHDITSFFPQVGKNNVLRKYCLHVLTDSSSVEVPRVQGIVNSKDHNALNADISTPVKIDLSEEYAKWLIPKSLFHKIEGYQEYLKNVFSDSINHLENKLLFDYFKDEVFQSDENKLKSNCIRGFLYDKKLTFINNLLLLKGLLPSRYLTNAVFLMSKKHFKDFYSTKDDSGRFVYNGENKLFGHEIVFVDELDDKILFGDLKQGLVLAEKLYPKIEMHSKFENPNQVGLSMPVSVGFGLINNDAIVGVSFTATTEENSKKTDVSDD